MNIILTFFLLINSYTDTSKYHVSLSNSKISVISWVRESSIIENKQDIIHRIQKVGIKEFNYKKTDLHMYYSYNPEDDSDMIFANSHFYDKYSIDNKIKHELYHLVHKHIGNTKHKNLIVKFNYDRYSTYFDNWRMVYLKNGKLSNKSKHIGKKLATTIVRDRKYFLSENEIFVRYCNLFDFLRNLYILEPHEPLNKVHIYQLENIILNSFASKPDLETENRYVSLLMHDFIMILPLINWNNIDNINSIFK